MPAITLAAKPLDTLVVQRSTASAELTAEGVVESVRTTVIAAQVSGSVTALTVKAGDTVKAGQVLVRIDTRLAQQQALGNQAQVAAAQAELAAARSEFERKQHLYEKHYISGAAMERAEADFKTAQAQAKAQLAQSDMARVQTGLHVLTAPYAGVVAEVSTELGGMVMPDKPLITLYDPKEMRAVANVPQSRIGDIERSILPRVELAGGTRLTGNCMTLLATADAVSQAVQVRVGLPINTPDLRPGMFARVFFGTRMAATASASVHIPAKSIVKRSELNAVYVLGTDGKPQLRQVRLGRASGTDVEVLAGLEPGERLVLNPLEAAAR